MNDQPLPEVWKSDPRPHKDAVVAEMQAVLAEDRASRSSERWARLLSAGALIVLCPALFWCSARGVTPLVRAGYAMMAAGIAVAIFGEWLYFAWCREASPQSIDACSQLRKILLLQGRQSLLMKAAPVSSAPAFIGAALLGLWVYRQGHHLAGCLMWAGIATGWAVLIMAGTVHRARLDDGKRRIERLLSDLES